MKYQGTSHKRWAARGASVAAIAAALAYLAWRGITLATESSTIVALVSFVLEASVIIASGVAVLGGAFATRHSSQMEEESSVLSATCELDIAEATPAAITLSLRAIRQIPEITHVTMVGGTDEQRAMLQSEMTLHHADAPGMTATSLPCVRVVAGIAPTREFVRAALATLNAQDSITEVRGTLTACEANEHAATRPYVRAINAAARRNAVLKRASQSQELVLRRVGEHARDRSALIAMTSGVVEVLPAAGLPKRSVVARRLALHGAWVMAVATLLTGQEIFSNHPELSLLSLTAVVTMLSALRGSEGNGMLPGLRTRDAIQLTTGRVTASVVVVALQVSLLARVFSSTGSAFLPEVSPRALWLSVAIALGSLTPWMLVTRLLTRPRMRRHVPRFPLSASVVIEGERTEGIDLSLAGLGIRSSQALNLAVNSVVTLQLNLPTTTGHSAVSATGRVRNIRETAEGQIIGVSFEQINEESAEAVRSYLDSMMEQAESLPEHAALYQPDHAKHPGKKTRAIAERRPSLVMRATSFASMLGVMAGMLQITTPEVVQAAPTPASGAITGRAFRDYNQNGIWERTAAHKDNGEPGITISATCITDSGVDGVLGTADDVQAAASPVSTDINGQYSLTVPGSPCRVEAVIPTAKSFLKSSAAGGSLVQFVDAAGTADFALENPSEYCQANPALVATCFFYGDPALAAPTTPAQHDIAGSLTSAALGARFLDTGATYGEAIQKDLDGAASGSAKIFSASFIRRHSGVKDRKTARIYMRDAGSTSASPFLDLDSLLGTNVAGVDPHPLTYGASTYTYWIWYPYWSTIGYRCTYGDGTVRDYGTSMPPNCYFNDPDSFDAVGKRGLGDLDISEDGKTLYTVNLKTRQLYAIPVGYPAVAPTSAAQIGQFTIPTDGCSNAADARPFALAVKDGKVFVGGVCSGENVAAELTGWVQEFTPGATATAGSFSGRVYGPNPLPAPKTEAYWLIGGASCTGTWMRWANSMAADCSTILNQHVVAQPTAMMGDINFDGQDMIITYTDRSAFQIGNGAGNLTTDILNFYTNIESGYLLRSCRNAANTAWVDESAGVCGGVTGAGLFGAEVGKGPGNGQFYRQKRWMDTGHGTNFHGGIVAGSGVQAGGNPFVQTETDPAAFPYGNGVGALSNLTGERGSELVLMSGSGSFGKASGMGDLEALCDKAPVEIGNRLWIDIDGDGLQDPGETPVSGAAVQLFEDSNSDGVPDGAAIATATTDANGNYLFSSDTRFTATASNAYGVTNLDWDPLTPNNNKYVVVFPTSVTSGGSTYRLTPNDQTTDNVDSDASAANGRSSTVTITGSGHNDHTLDAGYTSYYSIGNRVWEDVNNNGLWDSADPDEAGMDGVTVRIRLDRDNNNIPDSDATAVAFEAAHPSVVTSNGGYYLFSGLVAGNYIIEVDTPNGYHTSTGRNDGVDAANTDFEGALLRDVDVDASDDLAMDDNGSDVDTVPGGVVRSKTVTLGGTPEPTGEPATPGWTDNDPTGAATQDSSANYTVDFGFFRPLSLGNLVWEDSNNNGRVDAGEPPIVGAEVSLFQDANDDGIPDGPALQTVSTDATGHYSFHNLGAGTYVVEVAPPGTKPYTSSTGTASAYEATVPDADAVDTDDDDNGKDIDGITGGTARSLPITLRASTEPINEVDRAINDPQGRLTDPSRDNDGNYTLDFGFIVTVSLGNLVWDDANDDGIHDPTEAGVDGVRVRLYDSAGNEVAVGPDGIFGTLDDAPGGILTSGGGFYRFNGLVEGEYQVEFDVPSNYRTSTIFANSPDADFNDDNDAPNTRLVGTVRTGVVVLKWGSEPTTDGDADDSSNLAVDLGIFDPTPSMTIRKFTNGCDAQLATGVTPPEAPCPGDAGNNNPLIASGGSVSWTYVVRNTGNVPLEKIQVTDDQGVSVSCPADVLPAMPAGGPAPQMTCTATGIATPGQYTNNGILNADAEDVPNVVGPLPQVTDISHYFGTDPGLALKKYTVTADPGDPASPGWAPPALTAVDDADAPAGADASGNHVVGPGSSIWWVYRIENTGNVELSTVTLDDSVEGSITCPATTLAAGGTMFCVASGTAIGAGQYTNTATVKAQDAVTDPTAPIDVPPASDPSAYFVPSADIKITKYTNSVDALGDADSTPGPTVEAGSDIRWTYIVENTGDIALTDIRVTDDKEGAICVVAGPLAPGATTTCTHDGTAVGGTYRNLGSVVATPIPVEGNLLTDVDDSNPSGYIGTLAAIGDFVWEDLNANGIQEAGEPPIANVTVRLLDASGAVVKTTTTDATGHYLFSELNPGVYQIEFVAPAGYTLTTPNVPSDDAKDSDAAATTLRTSLTDLVGDETDLTWDAGFFRPASLGDFVWYDDNDNGVQDAGEAPVAGVTVRLLSAAGAEIASTTTDSNGGYRFDGLRPGGYVVEFVLPAGAAFSKNNAGTNDAADSDANIGTGQSHLVTLTSGQHDPTIDAGIVRLGSIGDLLWWDTNKNGIQDGGEAGVPRQRVVLLDADGAVVAETTTDENGKYLFENLRPATYVVWFAQVPVGRIFTGMNSGDDAADSDADISTGRTGPVVLGAGEHIRTVDAGIYNPLNPKDTSVEGTAESRVVPVTPPPAETGSATPAGTLPRTGSEMFRWVAVGLAAILSGGVLLGGVPGARRRRREVA